MELLIDRVLNERYQIQSLLGRQTGRRTFLAQDLQTEQSVVLKLLLFGSDFTWDDLKLFEREAEVLRSLDLPTIPKYLDCFDVDTELGKGFVFVQAYIEAKSLQNWLDSGRTFSEEELIAIATQLLTILDYLHSRQPAVIHRDIKPSNILLGDSRSERLRQRSGNSPGQIYLVDFGSVKTAANGSTMTIVGTYGYMPPEQFGGQTTPASDLYALGATIICLATGQHPSELPHRDMRIDFVERVNLSARVTNWLKSLTEISVDSRLKSASVALLALSTPDRENISTFGSKPYGSKLKLKKTDRVFKISIPPKGFHSDLIMVLIIIPIWIPMTSFLISAGVANFTIGGWMLLLFSIPFLCGSLSCIWAIILDLFGTRKLQINESKISLFSVVFGLRCLASMAPRQYLDRIEVVPLTYAIDSDDNRVPVMSSINIWAGNQQFCLDNSRLTALEQQWLVHELTQWLDSPAQIKLQKLKKRTGNLLFSNINISSNKLEQ